MFGFVELSIGWEPQVADEIPDPVALPPRIRFEDAERLLATLSSGPTGKGIVIDASAVEVMTSAGVVVLLSVMAARTDGPPLVVQNASPDFVDAFNDLGLFGEMMKMEFRT